MFETDLIEEVQKYSCLYDKFDPDYRSKLVRDEAWIAIGASIGVAAEQCQSRWRTLRDRFVRELTKNPELRNATPDDVKNDHWQYLEQMLFLGEYITPTRDRSNFEHKLIKEVQKYPYIYDSQHPEYRTKLLRIETWDQIATALGTTLEQCQTRWKSLRERFVVEVNKGRKSCWHYFNAMSFLTDHVTQTKNLLSKLVEQTLEDSDLTQDETQISINQTQLLTNFNPATNSTHAEMTTIEFEAPIEYEPATTTASKCTKRKAVDEARTEFNKIIAKIDGVIDKHFIRKAQLNEDESFHKYLASILQKVDENDRDRIQVEIIAFASKRVQEVKNETINNIIINI